MAMDRVALRPVGVALFLILVWPAVVWAQDSIQVAQTLYAAASYDEALAVLDRLESSGGPAASVRQVQENRALCLLALGRVEAANQAIEAVVMADPLYRPDEASASPRVRAAYDEVRGRLLPGIIETRYREARADYDRQDWPHALAGFHDVVTLAGDPALDATQAKSVEEYKVLASDFGSLAEKASQPAPPPAPAPASPAPAETTPVAPPPAAVDYTRIFGASDPDVVPPVTLRQELPAWRENGRPQPRDGVVEVTISASGTVERATLVQTMSPFFDAKVLESTRNWRYQPATLDGHPVRYRKAIRVTFQ